MPRAPAARRVDGSTVPAARRPSRIAARGCRCSAPASVPAPRRGRSGSKGKTGSMLSPWTGLLAGPDWREHSVVRPQPDPTTTRHPMSHPLCETCGTQFEAGDRPPERCPVCEDERQYVGWRGQRWTDMAALRAGKRLRIEEDAGLLGIGVVDFAIPQRALLLPTDAGNLLWECV